MTCTTTLPNTYQLPGNQEHSSKAISDIAFCSPFFFSCGHEQW